MKKLSSKELDSIVESMHRKRMKQPHFRRFFQAVQKNDPTYCPKQRLKDWIAEGSINPIRGNTIYRLCVRKPNPKDNLYEVITAPKLKSMPSMKSDKPLKSDELPATRKMLFEVRDELRSEIRASQGNFKAIDGRSQAIEGTLAAIQGTLQAMNGRFEAMEGRFDAMDGKFNAMDGRLNAMDAKWTAQFHRIEFMMEEEKFRTIPK
jgi:hypothetical protein